MRSAAAKVTILFADWDSEGGASWIGVGRVRARESRSGLQLSIDGLTTQAKYYKPLIYEFFRKEWRVAPAWGDYEVQIHMEYVGDPPWLDLDNLAKALLDSIKGSRLPRRRAGFAAAGRATPWRARAHPYPGRSPSARAEF